MMSKQTFSCVFLVVVVHLMMIMEHVTCIPTVVTLRNEIPNEILNVHCHSKDDDLGWQIVAFGSSYVISFEQNVQGTTIFACDFSAGTAYHMTSIIVFRGFMYGPNMPCSTKCTWTISPSGFYDNGVFSQSWAPWFKNTKVNLWFPLAFCFKL
jgi:hypothetical protein